MIPFTVWADQNCGIHTLFRQQASVLNPSFLSPPGNSIVICCIKIVGHDFKTASEQEIKPKRD